ncbi:MAG: hypothetical protein J5722_07545 [Oscillospiraceae bacterium]|nr:hypothetical protein [Oscillospiraceae bacterium]
MKCRKIIPAVLLLAAVCGISALLLRYRSDQRLFSMPEDAVYAEMSRLSAGKLIRKINRMEKKLPAFEDKTALLPLYTALIDKAGEFSEDELITLIREKNTGSGIECAFVDMYAADGYDGSKIFPLLNDPEIAEETKEHIAGHCDFPAEDLCEMFRTCDGRTAVIAIKRIAASDSEKAMELVQDFLNGDNVGSSDEKYTAVCLGIAQYYEEHKGTPEGEEMKRIYVPMIQKIFAESSNALVRDQAIYALGRMCDYDLFAWVIENDRIESPVKISVIERNVKLMLARIETAESEDDIRAVIEAMEILPTLEIGDALQDATDQGKLPASDALLSLIARIRTEGVPAVNKYD